MPASMRPSSRPWWRLPASVAEKIQLEVRAALTTPAMRARLVEMDLRVEASTPQESERCSREDFGKWGTVARQTQLQLN